VGCASRDFKETKIVRIGKNPIPKTDGERWLVRGASFEGYFQEISRDAFSDSNLPFKGGMRDLRSGNSQGTKANGLTEPLKGAFSIPVARRMNPRFSHVPADKDHRHHVDSSDGTLAITGCAGPLAFFRG